MGSRLSMRASIFWNCRGLGSSSAVHSLLSLVRKYSPSILFLSETKCNEAEIRRLKDKLNFGRCVWVEAVGRAGGLALFWEDDIDIRVSSLDSHRIDCMVHNGDGSIWKLTGIYGWPENAQKSQTWGLIRSLGSNTSIPWLLGGDFNEVLRETEKRGGSSCDFNNICAFRDCLDAHGLSEVDGTGNSFTWRNNRVIGFIEENLDRFVANDEWRALFPMASAENITWDGSDHIPIMVHFRGFDEIEDNDVAEQAKPCRFEARWLQHDDFDSCMRNF